MSGSWPALAPHVACSFVLLLGIFAGPISAYEFADSDHYYHSYETGYMSDFGQDWNIFNGRLNQPKCIDIPKNLTLCRDIGYTQMRLPNLLDHDSIREVTQQASTWVSLINIQCHPDTQLFLCSLFSPVCLNRPIPPCRNLCLAVKEGCSSKMKFYGFPWPDMLRCDKFPLENDLCIGPQTDNKPDESLCEACNHPKTFEAIVDAYCQADFAFRFKVDESVVSGSDLKIMANRKKKMYKKGNLKKRDIQDLTFYISEGLNCECHEIEAKDGKKSNEDYIGMGQKLGDKLIMNFVQKFDKKDPAMKKALRAIRKETICKDGIKAITGDGAISEDEKEATVDTNTDEDQAMVEAINGKKKKGKNGKKKRKDKDQDEVAPTEETEEAEEVTEEVTEDNSASAPSNEKKKDRRSRGNKARKNSKQKRSRDKGNDRKERKNRRNRDQDPSAV